MRFGLVGTGPWAEMAHGPGLVAAEEVELVGVWGRRPEPAAVLAASLGTRAYDDYRGLLGDVDAVAFAVPPDVQADLALTAVRAGRHVLLDKPVATEVAAARRLADAVDEAGVASVVFFTDRFVDTSRQWFEALARTGGWQGGWLRWFSALHEAGNPFGGSPWRQEHGALWDIGPHALSTLSTALGSITAVTAAAGQGDLVTLLLTHDSGATSTATLSQFAPPAVAGFEAVVWGETGFSTMPLRPEGSPAPQLALAADELVGAATHGRSHPLDVRFGVRVVELLADAAAQIDAARSGPRGGRLRS